MQAGVDLDLAHADAASMSTFPMPENSRDAVWAAGLEIAKGLVWPEHDYSPEADYIREVFRVAHNWRESHGWPLRRVRNQMMGRIRSTRLDAFTAARVKRMASIRPKLAKGLPLDVIQDLGGCRCVTDNHADLTTLLDASRGLGCFNILKEDDYIRKPKPSGYRSHHLIVGYAAQTEEDGPYDGLFLEIQLRTELQHTWATANEAMGLYKGQHFKSGQGDPDWLRFFALMSAEIAEIEGLPMRRDAPERSLRREEIRDLAARLRAPDLLNACASAFREIVQNTMPSDPPAYWLVTWHAERREVEVQPQYMARMGFEAYERAERLGENTVLVDSTRIESLRREFPNYFGDVRLFQNILASITGGRDTSHFAIKGNRVLVSRPKEKPDPYALRPQPWRKWR